MATNIWMIDTVITRNIAINTGILGITRKTWGFILSAAALVISFVICYRSYKFNRITLPLLCGLIFTIIFLFSTRVQARYIIYLLPFLIISASIEKKFRIPLAGFTLVSIFECTAHIWFKTSISLHGMALPKVILLLTLSILSIFLFIRWLIEILQNSDTLMYYPEK